MISLDKDENHIETHHEENSVTEQENNSTEGEKRELSGWRCQIAFRHCKVGQNHRNSFNRHGCADCPVGFNDNHRRYSRRPAHYFRRISDAVGKSDKRGKRKPDRQCGCKHAGELREIYQNAIILRRIKYRRRPHRNHSAHFLPRICRHRRF